MTSPPSLVLSVDELRAVHRLAALCLPRFVLADDEDDARVDVAAVRGLAARELVRLDPAGDAVLVTGLLSDLLAPCRAARWIAEIDIEARGVLDRHAVIVDDAGAAVVASELAGGLVALRITAGAPREEVRRLSRVDEVSAPAVVSPFTVNAQAHRDADELALSGDDAAAVQLLVTAGVPEPAARAWITAVCGRRCSAAVTVASNLGAGPQGPFEISEVRWLVDGDGGGWRVRSGEPDEEDGAEGNGGDACGDADAGGDAALSALAPVSGAELRDGLEPAPAGAR